MRRLFLPLLTLIAIAWMGPHPHEAAEAASGSEGTLSISFIDVEGGQSTLIVTPERQSLLIDTGFPGFDDRDPRRILAAVREAGLTRLDYLLLTHFHQDHIGGVAAIAAELPIGAFVDHDLPVDTDRFTVAAFRTYEPLRTGKRQIHPRAGNRLSLKGIDLVVASADGGTLARSLPGGGQINPECAAFEKQPDDPGENARSVGIWLRFGRFRFLDLGDLNWNKLAQLVCPTNLLGRVDLYLVSHHGNADSNLPQFLAAVQPRVAVLNNGATKGGAPDTFAALHRLPGLETVWQLHRSNREGAENFPDHYIANAGGVDEGHSLKLTASRDGSFTLVNSANGFTQSYPRAR